jgi:hypothetical protein
MTRHFLLLFLLFSLRYTSFGQGKRVPLLLNPTGSYRISEKPYIWNGMLTGDSGLIKVKLISTDRIVVSLFIQKAPRNHEGSFQDTLLYNRHSAVYHHCEDDTFCRITFEFTPRGVNVSQTQANLNFACGFGQGVFADGFYKKVSAKVPEIDPEE